MTLQGRQPLDYARARRTPPRLWRRVCLGFALLCLVIGIVGLWTAWSNFGEFDIMPVPGPGPPPNVVQQKEQALRRFAMGACIGVPIGIAGFVLLVFLLSGRKRSDSGAGVK